MKAYVLWDLMKDIVVDIFLDKTKARSRLLSYIKDNYSEQQWKDFAHNNGYDSVEEFQNMILLYDDYDYELGVDIYEHIVL